MKFRKTLKQNKKRKMFKFNWHIFNKLLVVIFIAISISYVVSINDIAIKGFVLNELKTNIQILNEENQGYELKIAELKTYENIDVRAKELKMVKADNVGYITVINETVAKK